jgi:hypothetical protein
MRCPDEIAEALCAIIEIGILRVRNQAHVNAEACSVEADHLHNIPKLLTEFYPELLDYYLDVERSSYLSSSVSHAAYIPHWEKLLALRDALNSTPRS